MKRLTLAATTLVAVAVPGVAQAQLSHSQTTAYGKAYAHVVKVFGWKAAGCKLIGPNSTCHVAHPSDGAILASIEVLHRYFAPPPVHHYYVRSAGRTVGNAPSVSYSVASTGSGYSSNGYCGAYQFDQQTWSSIGMPGSPCGASAGMQDQAAQKLKDQRGLQPWPVCGARYYSGGWAAVRQCENSGSYAP